MDTNTTSGINLASDETIKNNPLINKPNNNKQFMTNNIHLLNLMIMLMFKNSNPIENLLYILYIFDLNNSRSLTDYLKYNFKSSSKLSLMNIKIEEFIGHLSANTFTADDIEFVEFVKNLHKDYINDINGGSANNTANNTTNNIIDSSINIKSMEYILSDLHRTTGDSSYIPLIKWHNYSEKLLDSMNYSKESSNFTIKDMLELARYYYTLYTRYSPNSDLDLDILISNISPGIDDFDNIKKIAARLDSIDILTILSTLLEQNNKHMKAAYVDRVLYYFIINKIKKIMLYNDNITEEDMLKLQILTGIPVVSSATKKMYLLLFYIKYYRNTTNFSEILKQIKINMFIK
jgi:hypothetical protein